MAFNPFEHHHPHYDDDDEIDDSLDPAQQSMADALRVSFFVLKVAMLIVFVLYLCSGMFNVKQGEEAIVLRFGKKWGEEGRQVLKPGGPYFAFPYPIDRVERVDTTQTEIKIRKAFWFALGEDERASAQTDHRQGTPGPLDPERDGSLITGDANIVHAMYTVKYKIDDVAKYLENRPEPQGDVLEEFNTGEISRDEAIQQATDSLVLAAVESAVLFAVAQVRADEFVKGGFNLGTATKKAQKTIDASGIGITIKDLTVDDSIFPLTVGDSVGKVTSAQIKKDDQIDQAQKYRQEILVKAAGPAYTELLNLIGQYEETIARKDEAQKKSIEMRLDSVFESLEIASETGPKRVEGDVASLIEWARTYQINVISEIRGEAEAFVGSDTTEGALSRYRDNPEVFLNRRWQDAVQYFFSREFTEYMMIDGQPYLELNRNPQVTTKRDRAGIEVGDKVNKSQVQKRLEKVREAEKKALEGPKKR